MNRLVDALLARRDAAQHVTRLLLTAAGEVVPEEFVSFRRLLETLGDSLLSPSEQRLLQNSRDVRDRLEEGVLPTISAPDWGQALELAQGRVAADSGWWTVMVPATSGQWGLAVPQNNSPVPGVALFTRPEANGGVLAYDPANGALSEISSEAHCGPPSRGLCDPGLCHGCAPFQVYDRKTRTKGIKCICPDQPGGQR
jgi:hypothetical protein